MGLLWYGDQSLVEVNKELGQRLIRAAIHLTRRIKENLSISGRLSDVEEPAIRGRSIIRRGANERGKRTVTVTQGEFKRIAGPVFRENRRAAKRRARKAKR